MGIPATLSSIPAQTPYIQYVATSGQTVFPYPFAITQGSDLVVVDNGTTLGTDTGYSVSNVGNPTGGNVTLNSGASAGDIITLYRDIPIERLTQISQNGGFSSTAFNAEYNNIYLLLQQLQTSIDQCLQIPNTNNPAPTVSLTPGAYANKYLAFDANGNPMPAALTSSGSITQGILTGLLWPKTLAESNTSVTPTSTLYLPLLVDLRRYGGDPTGVAPSDAAMASALAVCGAAGLDGGTIWLPAGTYSFASPIVLTNGIKLLGDGSCTAGADSGTTIKYTGTGSSHFLQINNHGGCQVRGINITNTSGSFTGAMIGAVGSSLAYIEDVTFNATTSCYHLELNQAVEFTANHCNFSGGIKSVSGQSSAGGSFSNVVRFRDCQWINTVNVPVNEGGEAWSFDGCTFESSSTGVAGAFSMSPGNSCYALSFRGCWFGDASSGSGTWITVFGTGFSCVGSRFGGTASSNAISLNGVGGAVIVGNRFDTFGAALSLNTAVTKGLVFVGNYFTSVTTPIQNAATYGDGPSSVINPNDPLVGGGTGLAPFFIPTPAGGYEYSANGMLRQWGSSNVTAGSTAAVNFSKTFSATPIVIVGTENPAGPSDNAYAFNISTTGFTLSANNGTAGTVTGHWTAIGY